MRSYLIIGNSKKREKFIENFIKEQNIHSYSITKFEDKIKVKEAKEIRTIVSRKYSENTLVIIGGGINPVAQNSLLKCFEELTDNISIIISLNDAGEILDTIKSRLFTVNLYEKSDYESSSINNLLKDKFSEKLINIDKFLLENSNLNSSQLIDKFIENYRSEFFEDLDNLTKHEKKQQIIKIKRLLKVCNLIKFNNLNLRMAIESSLI